MLKTRPFYLIRRKVSPYLFISPFFILFSVFMLYPFVYSLATSLYKWDGIGVKTFVGFGNYGNLLKDKIFIQSLVNGVVEFLMYVPVMLFLALLFGFILNQKWLRMKGVFRAILFVPNVTSIVAVSYVFLLTFDTQYGLANLLLKSLGLGGVKWFASAFTSRLVLVSLIMWRWLGYNMVLMMAGLANIPGELYEAAKIDGADSRRIFFRITMPQMKPVILFCSVMSTMGTFSLFTEPSILTRGGPFNTTISTVLYLYNQAFNYLKVGYASSIAWVYFIIMFMFTLLQFRLNRSLDR